MTRTLFYWRTALKRLALILASLTATPALADFPVPDGCSAYMTVQQRSCLVTHYYTCEGEPEGHQWRADVGVDGPFFLSQIDREAQWILSLDLGAGTRETLVPDPADPASFTELSTTGLDTFDFTIVADNGDETRVVGFDRLTGSEVIVDGVTLQEVENQVALTDAKTGDLKWSAVGQEYISLKHRLFMSGIGTYTTPDGDETSSDDRPIEFAFPGDAGFLADKPIYDCNVQDAAFR